MNEIGETQCQYLRVLFYEKLNAENSMPISIIVSDIQGNNRKIRYRDKPELQD